MQHARAELRVRWRGAVVDDSDGVFVVRGGWLMGWSRGVEYEKIAPIWSTGNHGSRCIKQQSWEQ
jgi:hypothetical protein